MHPSKLYSVDNDLYTKPTSDQPLSFSGIDILHLKHFNSLPRQVEPDVKVLVDEEDVAAPILTHLLPAVSWKIVVAFEQLFVHVPNFVKTYGQLH